MTPRISVSQAARDFASTADRVATTKEPVVVAHNGHDVVAIIPAEDLQLLEELEELEDQWLTELVEEAEADPENQQRIPWEQIKAELNL